MTFSLVYLNGKFDSSVSESLYMKVVSNDSSESKKGPCYHLVVNSENRSPSSTESKIMSFGDIHICSNSMKGAKIGDRYILKAKDGFFSEKWIYDIAKHK